MICMDLMQGFGHSGFQEVCGLGWHWDVSWGVIMEECAGPVLAGRCLMWVASEHGAVQR